MPDEMDNDGTDEHRWRFEEKNPDKDGMNTHARSTYLWMEFWAKCVFLLLSWDHFIVGTSRKQIVLKMADAHKVTLVTAKWSTRCMSPRCLPPLNESTSHWKTQCAHGPHPRLTSWDMWSSNGAWSQLTPYAHRPNPSSTSCDMLSSNGVSSQLNMLMGSIPHQPPEICGLWTGHLSPSEWNAAIF